jgi:hypothetical protein
VHSQSPTSPFAPPLRAGSRDSKGLSECQSDADRCVPRHAESRCSAWDTRHLTDSSTVRSDGAVLPELAETAVLHDLSLVRTDEIPMIAARFHDDNRPPTVDLGTSLDAEGGLDWEDSPRQSGLALLASMVGTGPIEPSWLSGAGVRFCGHRF